MNSILKTIGICFFIVGCCTFRPTSKTCTCKEIYKNVEYHFKENIDTTQSFSKRYIKYNSSHLTEDFFDKAEYFFNKNQQCWIGKKKQLIIDLFGKPDNDRAIQDKKWKRQISYSFDIGLPPEPLFPKGRSQKLYLTILYKKNFNEKINRINGRVRIYIE